MDRLQKKEALLAFLILFLFGAVLLFLSLYGVSGRVYARPPLIKSVSEPYHAYSIWNSAGVRGRLLILFDRRLNAKGKDTSLSPDNYIRLAINRNFLRKIYHIIPEQSWPRVKELLAGQSVFPSPEGIFKTDIEGTPLFIMRLKDITEIKETVLININADYWDEQDMEEIIKLFKDKVLRSDLVTLSGEVPMGLLEKIKVIHEDPA